MTYTPLGNGTPAGSNWTLTGLSLSTGQNIYIRARGYYRSGYQNGSESITESLRNAFIVPPPVLKIVSITRPANGHIVLQGVGVPNATHSVQASPDLSPNSFGAIGSATADNTGAWQYDDASAVGLTKRFYRVVFP